jgi:ABC-type Fe3+ transport system substrate-binding protein
MNISRTFSNTIKEFIQREYGGSQHFEIYDEPHRLNHESALLKCIHEGIIPALYIGHATDFGRLQQQEIMDNFEKLADLPLSAQLKTLGFENNQGYFHPITVIPFGVIYNKNLVEKNRASKWQDFLDQTYSGKIIMPDIERTISKVIVGIMKMTYPDTYKQFMANCTFKGSPIDVVNAVDNGEYHYGIVNIAFSRFSRLKNTGIMWMEEGTFCMPQIIAIGKGKHKLVSKITDFILSREIQDFFALQGFIPAVSGEIPKILNCDNLNLIWRGWDNFLSSTAN